MHPSKSNADLHYYLETALTDLAELYIIDQVSGKISKAISGDAFTFSKRAFDNRRTIF
jgi:hypothetical protein